MQNNLEESFSEGVKKEDNIRKYGMPNLNNKKHNNKYLIILHIILSIVLFLVILYLFYLLYYKNKTISKLKSILRDKIDEIDELATESERMEEESKIILEQFNELKEENSELIKQIEEANNNIRRSHEIISEIKNRPPEVKIVEKLVEPDPCIIF